MERVVKRAAFGRAVALLCFVVGVGLGIGLLVRGGVDHGAALGRFEYKARHMGVVARVVLYAEDEPEARAGANAAFERIAALEAIFSNYRADSEVGLLARGAVGVPVPVSADLFRVMQRADLLWRESDGAFDATVGPLSDLWREAMARGSLPDSAAIARARALTGWGFVDLDSVAHTVTLGRPGLRFDFGALAKGYAADEAIRVLRERGLSRALVELGGDIVVGNPPPGTDGWVLDGAELGAVRRLAVANAGVSTSGDSEQHLEVDGIRYSHIVDPRTGLGVTHGVRHVHVHGVHGAHGVRHVHGAVVTVEAADGLTADGLSTTVSVMGQSAGRKLALRVYPDAKVFVRTR